MKCTKLPGNWDFHPPLQFSGARVLNKCSHVQNELSPWVGRWFKSVFPRSSIICPAIFRLPARLFCVSFPVPGEADLRGGQRDPVSSGFCLGSSKGAGLVGGEGSGHICFPGWLWPGCCESCVPLQRRVPPMRQVSTCDHTLTRFWKFPSPHSPAVQAPSSHWSQVRATSLVGFVKTAPTSWLSFHSPLLPLPSGVGQVLLAWSSNGTTIFHTINYPNGPWVRLWGPNSTSEPPVNSPGISYVSIR